MNVPPSWNSMGFTAKAGYLTATHQAKDFSDACAKLKGTYHRKKKPAAVYAPAARNIRLPYAD